MKKIFLIAVLAAVVLWIAAAPFKVSAQQDAGKGGGFEKVLSNQEKMMNQLAEIKSELTKIKYRAR